MNLQVDPRVCRSAAAADHRTPTRDVQLDGWQAEQWLAYLERLAPRGEHAQTLAEFRSQLDDALWLANWKREYVVMELELGVVPSLIGAIASHEPGPLAEHSFDVQENILATLSKMSEWT